MTTIPEGHVLATWVGPYGYRMADGTTLDTGITQVAIGADEAYDSDQWKISSTDRKAIEKRRDSESQDAPDPEPVADAPADDTVKEN